jgi:hypothetical protein
MTNTTHFIEHTLSSENNNEFTVITHSELKTGSKYKAGSNQTKQKMLPMTVTSQMTTDQRAPSA